MYIFKSCVWGKLGFSNQELESLAMIIELKKKKKDNNCKIQFTNTNEHTA